MRSLHLVIWWPLWFLPFIFEAKCDFSNIDLLQKIKNLINQIASMLRIWIRKLMTLQLIWLPILHFWNSILGRSHYKSHNYLHCHDLVANKFAFQKVFITYLGAIYLPCWHDFENFCPYPLPLVDKFTISLCSLVDICLSPLPRPLLEIFPTWLALIF